VGVTNIGGGVMVVSAKGGGVVVRSWVLVGSVGGRVGLEGMEGLPARGS